MPVRWAVAATAAGVTAAAAASLALPSVPTTDPWGWIVWGRELLAGELNTDVGGSPSWKPLPVAFTTVLALLGDAAPEGWLFIARALGLAGVVLAYLAARRMAGRAAGVVAAAALVLSAGWVRGLEHGYTEPLVIAALLGALLAWLAGRPGVCLALAIAASLARPELWPLAIGVLLVAGAAMPRRAVGWTAVALVPVLWIGVDWLASGRPFNGSGVAAGIARELSPGDVLGFALAIPVAPVLLLALAGALWGGRLARVLGASALAWSLLLAAAVGLGYPGSDRLMTPVMAVLCALAGVGAARLARARPSFVVARAAPAAVGVAITAVSAPFVIDRAGVIGGQVRAAEERAELQLELRRTARIARSAAPGARAVVLPADRGWARGAVAWEWRLPLGSVRPLDDPPGEGRLYVFLPASRVVDRARPIARTRSWRVLVERRARQAGGPTFASAPGG